MGVFVAPGSPFSSSVGETVATDITEAEAEQAAAVRALYRARKLRRSHPPIRRLVFKTAAEDVVHRINDLKGREEGQTDDEHAVAERIPTDDSDSWKLSICSCRRPRRRGCRWTSGWCRERRFARRKRWQKRRLIARRGSWYSRKSMYT